MRVAVVAGLLLLASTARATDEIPGDPERGGYTKSLGLPQMWRLSAGAAVGAYFGDPTSLAAELRFNYSADILHPVMAILAFTAEGALGYRDTEIGASIRGILTSPSLRIGIGLDYSSFEESLSFIASLHLAVRRGGVFGAGSTLRLDYFPNRGNTVLLGVEVPLRRLVEPGQSRPKLDHVQLGMPPRAPITYEPKETTIHEAVREARRAGAWIRRLVVPFTGQQAFSRDTAQHAFAVEMREIEAHFGEVGTSPSPTDRAVATWHAEMERAFSSAVSACELAPGQTTPEGLRVAEKARQILFDEVLVPYDRLLGQTKKPDTLRGLGASAQGTFARWLKVQSGLVGGRLEAVTWVFARFVDVIEENRAASYEDWGDSRMTWLPLQYGLVRTSFDSRAELDAIIARIADEPFTEANHFWYVANEQFHLELLRTIHAARDYHVLWIHDYRGKNAEGKADEVGFLVTAEGYLRALIERIREYDRTGKLPVFMIFLDQWFYEPNEGKLWMALLENPLEHEMSLPAGGEKMEARIAELQRELRFAIAGSHLLQAERLQYGDDWLRNRVKVHVNITNPADPTFWSRQVVPLLGIPDNMMRDHRKIVFYDVTEEDPWRGEALLTGMGVGEHYVGGAWQDRALLASGPVNLELKDAARTLLHNQGFTDEQLPTALVRKELPADFAERAAARSAEERVTSTGLQLHNETGYSPKAIDAAKATLYTLLPAHSVLIIPDSLWNGELWGSMLTGLALRGGRVLIIAPSIDSAPSAGFPQMSRAEELLSRMVVANEILGDEMAATGGLLRVGIYAPQHGADDLPAQLARAAKGFRDNAFLLDLFGLEAGVLDELEAGSKRWDAEFAPRRHGPVQPKLHMKVNFAATEDAWRLLQDPHWAQLLHDGIDDRATQLLRPLTERRDIRTRPEKLSREIQALTDQYEGDLSALDAEEAALYMLLGSHNQNDRSFIMDGEVAYLVTGAGALSAMVDLLLIAPGCEWVETVDQLHRYLPPAGGTKRRLGQWMKIAL